MYQAAEPHWARPPQQAAAPRRLPCAQRPHAGAQSRGRSSVHPPPRSCVAGCAGLYASTSRRVPPTACTRPHLGKNIKLQHIRQLFPTLCYIPCADALAGVSHTHAALSPLSMPRGARTDLWQLWKLLLQCGRIRERQTPVLGHHLLVNEHRLQHLGTGPTPSEPNTTYCDAGKQATADMTTRIWYTHHHTQHMESR